MYTWARLLEFSRKSQQNIRHALHANVLFPRYKNFSRSLGRAMLEMRQHVQKTQIDVAQGRCPSPSFSLSAKKILSKKWLFGTKSQTKAVLARVLRICHFEWTSPRLSLLNISRGEVTLFFCIRITLTQNILVAKHPSCSIKKNAYRFWAKLAVCCVIMFWLENRALKWAWRRIPTPQVQAG